jgi:ABC-2 type transport system ATP-binding protein
MILEVDHLKVSIGGVPILHDVSLSLGGGEIYGLLGPNGAGKSTTIAAAIGLLNRDAGQVRVMDKDPQVEPKRIHAQLGVLPEQNGFYDWMTAEDYLGFYAALYGSSLRERDLRGRLSRFGLEPRRGQRIGTFSRGMRQRLGLARALIADPKLLILDEPTNGLDPRGRREIHDILIDLSANHGVGILLCTHLLDDVERLCKRIGVIVEGRTVTEGTIADLTRDHDRLVRFRLHLSADVSNAEVPPAINVVARNGAWCTVDLSPDIDPQTAWRQLLFRGWPITEIRHEGGGIEDLYLSLTEGRTA